MNTKASQCRDCFNSSEHPAPARCTSGKKCASRLKAEQFFGRPTMRTSSLTVIGEGPTQKTTRATTTTRPTTRTTAAAVRATATTSPEKLTPPFDLKRATIFDLAVGVGKLFAESGVAYSSALSAAEDVEFSLRCIPSVELAAMPRVSFAVARSPLTSPSGAKVNGYVADDGVEAWVVLSEKLATSMGSVATITHELGHLFEDGELGAWQTAARWLSGTGTPHSHALAGVDRERRRLT